MNCFSCKKEGRLRQVTDIMLLVGRRRYPQMTFENKLCENCYTKLRTATQKMMLSRKIQLIRKEESMRSHLAKSSSNTNSSSSTSNSKADSDTNNNSGHEPRVVATANITTNNPQQTIIQSESTFEPSTQNSWESSSSVPISNYSEEPHTPPSRTTAQETRKRANEIEKTPKGKKRKVIVPPDDSDEESGTPIAGPSRQNPPIRVTRTNSTDPQFRNDVPVYNRRFPGG